MAYTKQQLIDAYCRASNCEASDLPAHEARHQTWIDKRKAEVQARLNAIPSTAKELMKNVALKQLAKEEAEQAVVDNSGVSL